MVVELKMFLCSHCTHVYNSHHECLLHEQSMHPCNPYVKLKQPASDQQRPIIANPSPGMLAFEGEVYAVTTETLDERDMPTPQLEDASDEIPAPTNCVVQKMNNTFPCDKCAYVADSQRSYFSHYNALHKTKNPIIKCTYCEKTFTRLYHRKTHENHVHLDSDEWKCKEVPCAFNGRSKTSLLSHMMVHSEERKFGCDTCDKAFKTARHMRRHRLTHVKTATLG